MNDILMNLAGSPIFGWTPPLPREGGTSWMYPICILLGFAVAIALSCIKMWWRYKISIEPFYWFILIAVPTAIIGARFGSCAIGQTPWNEFFVNFGSGLAVEWGVIFVVIAAAIYFPLVLRKPKYRVKDIFSQEQKVKQVSFWMYVDAVMPCILIAQFIGRWGNYCNQEVYGAVVTNQGLINFLDKVLPGMYIDGAWRQPLFLWEGLGNLAMFFVLYFGIEFIKGRKAGDMGAAYIAWYGIFRACLEPLRDQTFKFVTSIVLSIIFAVLGIGFIIFNHLFLARKRNYYLIKAFKVKAYDLIFGFAIVDGNQYKDQQFNKLTKQISETNKEINLAKAKNKTKKVTELEQEAVNLSKTLYELNTNGLSQGKLSCFRQEQDKLYYGAW